MALSGPPGKGNKLGRTPSAEWTEVADRPFAGPSPDLPALGGRRKWQAPVVAWWETLRRMPHCVLWRDSDWQYALETAYLRQAFWTEFAGGEVRSTMATELRRRDDQLGTTAEARRKLRIRLVPADEYALPGPDGGAPGGDGTITDLASRRRRLTA